MEVFMMVLQAEGVGRDPFCEKRNPGSRTNLTDDEFIT